MQYPKHLFFPASYVKYLKAICDYAGRVLRRWQTIWDAGYAIGDMGYEMWDVGVEPDLFH
jgi:hypothetical protein